MAHTNFSDIDTVTNNVLVAKYRLVFQIVFDEELFPCRDNFDMCPTA